MKLDEVYVGYSDLDDVVEQREEILKQYPEAKGFYLSVREEYGSYGLYLEFMRNKAATKLLAEKKTQESLVDREKETYLHLKKKFGESDV